MRGTLAILFLTVVITVPTTISAAGWGAKGQQEPDTSWDKTGPWMQKLPDQTAGGPRKVYFNAFTSQSAGFHAEVGTSFNPNVATLGSERQSWNGRHIAMLGVWQDCNKDGFVGLGDNGVFEYRREILVATAGESVCPVVNPGAIPTTAASHNWTASHNDGTWVLEWIPIGFENGQLNLRDLNPYNYNDAASRVWIDWGSPTSPPELTRCYAFAPEGAYHTTGGFLQFVDCFDGFAITDTFNEHAAPADGLGLGQVTFSDHPHDQYNSDSMLNQKNPWGDHTDDSAVSVFDCNSAVIHKQSVATFDFTVRSPRSQPTTNDAGSPAGTVSGLGNELDDCNAATDEDKNQWGYQLANAMYSQETKGIAITAADGKQQTDFTLAYQEGQRPPIPGVPVPGAGTAFSKDAGTRATEVEGFWTSRTVIGEDRNPFVGRAGLEPNPVQYVSAYAFVSPTAVTKYALSLPNGGATATYGAEACGTSAGVVGAPNKAGWKCDPHKWWPGSCVEGYNCCGDGYACDGLVNGNSIDVSVAIGAKYNLRDIDCYDTSIQAARDLGIGYGILTGTACV